MCGKVYTSLGDLQMHCQKRGHTGGDAAFAGGGSGGNGGYEPGQGGYGHEMQDPYAGGGSMAAYPADGGNYAGNYSSGGAETEMKSLF